MTSQPSTLQHCNVPLSPLTNDTSHIAPAETNLNVRVHSCSFIVPNITVTASSSSSTDGKLTPLFTTTGTRKKQRSLLDPVGIPLCTVQRRYFNTTDAWRIRPAAASGTETPSPVTMAARLRWTTSHSKFDITFPTADGASKNSDAKSPIVEVRGQDLSHRETLVLVDGRPIMVVLRTRASERKAKGEQREKGLKGKYLPVWEARVGEGVDLVMATLIVLMLADNFLEMQQSLATNPLLWPLMSRW